MSADGGRLDRLELKLDSLQSQSHQNHIELLSAISKKDAEVDDEISKINLKLERHDSYFTMVARSLGLGGVLAGWLSLKDIFGK